ncbi:unnamed protein product [Pleuronectes platessa]|uniref:Uncharacterized protein n=1 Tax=Pleuronectes platessa TaxID=8262 RepID=A0A9N7UH45_PLEPL|nr:unnamed protein product [Pleuronectes platessa]
MTSTRPDSPLGKAPSSNLITAYAKADHLIGQSPSSSASVPNPNCIGASWGGLERGDTEINIDCAFVETRPDGSSANAKNPPSCAGGGVSVMLSRAENVRAEEPESCRCPFPSFAFRSPILGLDTENGVRQR